MTYDLWSDTEHLSTTDLPPNGSPFDSAIHSVSLPNIFPSVPPSLHPSTPVQQHLRDCQ